MNVSTFVYIRDPKRKVQYNFKRHIKVRITSCVRLISFLLIICPLIYLFNQKSLSSLPPSLPRLLHRLPFRHLHRLIYLLPIINILKPRLIINQDIPNPRLIMRVLPHRSVNFE